MHRWRLGAAFLLAVLVAGNLLFASAGQIPAGQPPTIGQPPSAPAQVPVPDGPLVLGPLGPPAVGAGFATWVDVADREESRQFFLVNYLHAAAPDIAWTGDRGSCSAGTTSQVFQDSVMLRINYYRAMAGIPPQVTSDATYSAKAQQAALMMSAHGALSHAPPVTWTCYSADGAQAAGSSNLALGYYGTGAITAYIKDNGTNNGAVGHRRWVLYPQTQNMGTGDIAPTGGYSSNSLWVFDGRYGSTRPATREPFVAWPPPGYVAYQVVYPRWSFSYPGGGFSQATVTMTQGGQPVPVVTEAVATGYGENTIVWIPNGMTSGGFWPQPQADTTYHVTIGNVTVGDSPQTFSYDVTVIDPGTTIVPAITWATPAPIGVGTALGSGQLNASADVPGTFVYDPPAGTILPAGTATLSATFTPDDTSLYESVTTTVQLEVSDPLVVSLLSADRSSPSPSGAPVTWTATATGGTAPLQYQFWRYKNGGGWTMVQVFGTGHTYTWTPGDLDAGGYTVQVWVRSDGSTASYDAWFNSATFVVANPLVVSGVTPNRTSPILAGTPVSWTVGATGGVAPLQYQFWRYKNGAGWSLGQGWGTSNVFAWTPGISDAGTYTIQAWVRNAGSTATYDAWTNSSAMTVAGPLVLTSVTASRTSPVGCGLPVTWTATATGGLAPVQYQFARYKNGVGWTTAQTYGTSNTYTWTPSCADAGTYTIQVWARNAGSAATYDAWANSAALVVANPLVVTSVTPNPSSPVGVGTPVTWTVNTSGGTAPLQYQFWVYSSATGWSLLQGYSTSASASWVPASAGTYTVQAWVRNAGSGATYDAWVNSAPIIVQ